MKTKLLISIIFFFLLIAFMHKVNAQESLRTFTISPPAVQIELDPGKQTEGTIKIINDGDSSLTFQTSIQDFIVKDDNGTPEILPPNTLSNKYSGAAWVGVYPDVVTIAPHQKAILSYYVQIPQDARPGGHYAAVMYTPTSALGVSGTGTAVSTSVGTLFYITVNGPVTTKAIVNSFKFPGLSDFGPVSGKTQILNLSDVHITPKGSITVKNMLGQTSDVKNLKEFNIFPGVARNYETSLGKKLMFGFYKATLNATYGSDNLPLTATASFIVFPWKIAAFIVLLALVLSFGYRYWKRDNSAKHENLEA